MTTPLTPALALAYLDELSTDIRAAVVLDAGGAALAGASQLAGPAHRLLQAAESADDLTIAGVRLARTPDGVLLVAEGPNGVAIALLAGPCALLPLLGHDLVATASVTAATSG